MTNNTLGIYAPFPVGGVRLWDTGTKWDEINTAPGVFNFTNVNNRLAEANTRGVDVIWTMGCVPDWTHALAADKGPAKPCQGSTAHSYALPDDVKTGDNNWKNFITALVNDSLLQPTHIKYYELNNEADLTQYCGTPGGAGTPSCNTDPTYLVQMAQDAYTLIHSLDPSALVIGPAPSTACTNNCGVHFLPQYYAAGGAPWQDIVAFHAYTYGIPTGGQFSNVPEQMTNYVSQMRSLMAANGISGLPLWVTEGAWGGGTNNSGMTDDQKVAYIARDYLLLRIGGVARFYWYAYSNSTFGTLFSGGVLRPAGVAYSILESWLVGSTDLPANCSQDGASTWKCSITYHGNPAIIIWNPSNTPTVSLSPIYQTFLNLDDTNVHPIVGPVVAGLKPIMVLASSPAPPPSPAIPMFTSVPLDCPSGCAFTGKFSCTPPLTQNLACTFIGKITRSASVGGTT